MTNPTPSTIYGPVESWRLGRSLGVDLLCVDSICSFECVYCQLGKINRVTTKREVFVSTEKVLKDLKNSDWQQADVITFSGSGEPFVNPELPEFIEYTTKKGIETAVISHGGLLTRERAKVVAANMTWIRISLNAGTAHAMAQAQHGSAPDIAGQDRANPASLIGSAAMLLAWLGERRDDGRFTRAAAAIEDALDRAIATPHWRTGDLGGPLGTKAFGARVAALVEEGARE